MGRKPSYEELKQRIKALETERLERNGTERVFGESGTDFLTISNCFPAPMFIIDREHMVIHWNRACENLTGIVSHGVVGTGKHWSAFYPEERPVLADLIVDDASEEEISLNYEGNYKKSDVIEGGYEAEDFYPYLGETGKWLNFTAVPLQDREGNIIGAMEVFREITDRKSAEEAMHAGMHELEERNKELNCLFKISNLVEEEDTSSERLFQGVVDCLPPAWCYPEIACARIILGDNQFKTSNFKETEWQLLSDILIHGKKRGTLEVDYLEEKPLIYEGPFMREERELLDVIGERLGRILERRQAEEAIKESEERFRELLEHSLTGISIIQGDTIIYQNPEQERLLGPLPRPFILVDPERIHSSDREKVKQFYETIRSGKFRTIGMEFRISPINQEGPQGEMQWVYCRMNRIEYQGKQSIIFNVMNTTSARNLENVLRIQDKMTSLGRVATGIAHEIRNPLSGINIYLDTLEKMLGKGGSSEKIDRIIGQMQSASGKIESVIRRVLDFSRPAEPHFISTNINRPIEDAIDLSAVTMRKMGIMITRTLADDLPPCRTDPGLIEQVVLNLINNAAEAMREMAEGDKRIAITSSGERDAVLVKISDSGPGIPPTRKGKIFDPFYSTKNGSTGIGLSLANRIITDHGGSFDVSKSRWGGAEFTITIPIQEG